MVIHTTLDATRIGKLGSLKGAMTNRNRALERYDAHPNICKYCNKRIEVRNGTVYETMLKKYCDSSCAAKATNVARGKKQKCIVCGKRCKDSRQRYCSKSCGSQFIKDRNITNWKNKEVNGSRGKVGRYASYIRRYLFEKHNGKCQTCGWNQTTEFATSPPLEVHHKDGNSKNNEESNLQLLCPNCHSLTPNFGNRKRKGIIVQ